MQVSPVNSAVAATTTTSTGTTTPAPKTLGQADFLKLLAQQFQGQDPMKPADDTAFIAQMAQFTSLDQTSTLVQQMTQMRTTQDISTATNYLGRQVTVDAGNGKTDTGVVTSVDMSSGKPQIIVNQNPYTISAVLSVEPSPASTSTSTTPSATTGA